MKLSSAVAFPFFVLLSLTSYTAAHGYETNAERLAHGLPPRPPRKFYKPSTVAAAKRATASSKPSPNAKCPTGSAMQCCEQVVPDNDPTLNSLLSSYGVPVPTGSNTNGLTCAPVSAPSYCSLSSLCCKQSDFDSLFALDCTSP